MEKWREELYLSHSAKGTTWKKHKYIKIVNGKYYYKEDLDRAKRDRGRAASSKLAYDRASKNTRSGISGWKSLFSKKTLSNIGSTGKAYTKYASDQARYMNSMARANQNSKYAKRDTQRSYALRDPSNRARGYASTPSHIRGVVDSKIRNVKDRAISTMHSAIESGKSAARSALNKLVRKTVSAAFDFAGMVGNAIVDEYRARH